MLYYASMDEQMYKSEHTKHMQTRCTKIQKKNDSEQWWLKYTVIEKL